nr:trypsin-like serine protease [Thaumasiovibrio subtropicus]
MTSFSYAELHTAQQNIAPRIVGGQPANPADWTFFTQIVRSNSNRSYCGASYIGNGYVLTAAHCVDGDAPSQIAVKIGGSIYNGNDGIRANVSQMYIHPQYNATTYRNDIALLKLSQIPTGAIAVEIANIGVSQYAAIGDWLTVAGLGRTSEGGVSPSVLQEVDVPLVSDSVCRQSGGNYATVGDVSFCAGTTQGGIDSCQGDSGGPIVINQGGTITQLGIVSWGIGCARPEKYGVYSDIAALRPFIDDIIGNQPPTQNVSVGYTPHQSLSSFHVGEVKSHTFTITNNGQQSFTVDRATVSHSGVATVPVVSQNTCALTTLSAQQACQVVVEFTAHSPGSAEVLLTFDIDKTATLYQARAVVNVTNSTQPPVGDCGAEWQASAIYNSGDKVVWANQIWQAQWWTQGDNPSESGPWGVWQATSNADCSSTQPPTEPPVTEPPTTEPTPPSVATPYQAGFNYSAGDIVSHHGATYECQPWPNSLWCSNSAYEPGIGSSWQQAWKLY